MSYYIIITADFNKMPNSSREKVYQKLLKSKWVRIKNWKEDSDNTWYALFEETVSPEDAIKISLHEFISFSGVQFKPKLFVNWITDSHVFDCIKEENINSKNIT